MARARTRPRSDRAARRGARRHDARPRQPGAEDDRTHADRGVPPRVERGRHARRLSPGRGACARRRRSRVGGRGPLRTARSDRRRGARRRRAHLLAVQVLRTTFGTRVRPRRAARAPAPVQGSPRAERAARAALRDGNAAARALRRVHSRGGLPPVGRLAGDPGAGARARRAISRRPANALAPARNSGDGWARRDLRAHGRRPLAGRGGRAPRAAADRRLVRRLLRGRGDGAARPARWRPPRRDSALQHGGRGRPPARGARGPVSGDELFRRPVELLQELIRFDTTNPPGNEADCIAFVGSVLESVGCKTDMYEATPGRPNLVSRIAGGSAPPLLLQGHVDVVTTEGQQWTYPPFEARIADGFVWGRGALDMKGGVAMLVSAFARARADGVELPGDVILALLADEEGGGDLGARFLVEQHAELFDGVRYAISEFGGFSTTVSGRRFYPIQVAEKQICWLKATIRGPGGHGAKINLVPSVVEVELDGRTLPGFGPDDLIRELHDAVGGDVALELVRHDPGPAEPDLTLLASLGDIIRELDPDAIPVPLLQIGVTDARFFSRLGMQTYGFLPLNLPADFEFTKLIHNADERVPVAAVEFGAEAVFR